MTLEEVKELVEGYDRKKDERNKSLIAMIIISVFAMASSLTDFGDFPIFGIKTSLIVFGVLLFSVIGTIIAFLKLNIWLDNRSSDEMALLHFHKYHNASPEQLHEMDQKKHEHEQKVLDWFNELSPEDKEMANWYAKKHFNDTVSQL